MWQKCHTVSRLQTPFANPMPEWHSELGAGLVEKGPAMLASETGMTFRIRLLKHKTTDLMLAVSDDLTGLMVPGRSEEEVVERLPRAIRELLEADGKEVASIELEEDSPTDFIPPAYIANARLVGPTDR